MEQNNHEKLEELTKESATAEIHFMIQQMAAMGANDSEIPTAHKILEKLEKDVISPLAAVEEVRRMLNSKQDYH